MASHWRVHAAAAAAGLRALASQTQHWSAGLAARAVGQRCSDLCQPARGLCTCIKPSEQRVREAGKHPGTARYRKKKKKTDRYREAMHA
uniref:Uncharacterized protein n=1 Tax=Oryza barthii TaxID=65489 RepID=A0A0D3G4L4_9ORYZ